MKQNYFIKKQIKIQAMNVLLELVKNPLLNFVTFIVFPKSSKRL